MVFEKPVGHLVHNRAAVATQVCEARQDRIDEGPQVGSQMTVRIALEPVSRVSDLLVYSLDELEAIAAENGGIRQLFDEKWRKVYRASAPRGMFTVRSTRPRAA